MKKDKLPTPFRPRHQKPNPTADVVSASIPIVDKPPISAQVNDPNNNPASPVIEIDIPTIDDVPEKDNSLPPSS